MTGPVRQLQRLAFAFLAVVVLCAAAPDPADRLADPAKEARARALFRDIRCLVCQSESIDDSEAPLAHDLRQLVRQQVAQGRSDAEIRDFLVARYGQFVLLTPRASAANSILWIGPVLVVFAGVVAIWTRRRRVEETSSLTRDEESALDKLSRR
jgi:cytochrome c-type biogenesis protein CcmH